MSSDKDKERPVQLVAREEEDRISRNMLKWLNTFPGLPKAAGPIRYEYLEDDAPCLALSLVQGTYIVERNIIGGYTAEYQFKVLYRIRPGNSMDRRLKADELLNRLGDWAAGQTPDIGPGLTVQELEPTARSALDVIYEDGSEDHQIFMKLTYRGKP